MEAINLYILTSLNDLHEAQKILHWLKSHGIDATLEGQLTYKMGPHIPNGLGIYVLNGNQYQHAKRLFLEYDSRLPKSEIKNRTVLEKLRVKNLDRLVVALATILLIGFVIWLASNLVV